MFSTWVSRWSLVCRNGSLFLLPSTTCVLALGLLWQLLCLSWSYPLWMKGPTVFLPTHRLCVSSCIVLGASAGSCVDVSGFLVDKHSVLPLLGCSVLCSIPRALKAPQWSRKPFTWCFCVLLVLGFSNFLVGKISPFFSPNVVPAYVPMTISLSMSGLT